MPFIHSNYRSVPMPLVVLVGYILFELVVTVDSFSSLSCSKSGRHLQSSVFRSRPSRGSFLWSIVNQTITEATETNCQEAVEETTIDTTPDEDSTTLTDEEENTDSLTAQQLLDREFMEKAIELAQTRVGQRANYAPYPRPVSAAILVSSQNQILGTGITTCNVDAIYDCLINSGLEGITPLHHEWFVSWPSNAETRRNIEGSTLYVTLEPSAERKGESSPPLAQLIVNAGIPRVVIGCPDPVSERATKGASLLHASGLNVEIGVHREQCEELIAEYAQLANTKLHRVARKQVKQFGRPLGFLHCSVIDSDDAEAFARNGNAFGNNLGLSRDTGAYEIAPPPFVVWVGKDNADDNEVVFEDEEQGEVLQRSPMMPWYEQVDAVVVTFPKVGNGPSEDQSVKARLIGLRWLATYGKDLPSGVERILVLDAADITDLPLTNDDPNLPPGVDVEEFWKADGRKPTRVLLRFAACQSAALAASAAAESAARAARAAQLAKEALESGDAEAAAEVAIQCQDAAISSMKLIQRDVEVMQVSMANSSERIFNTAVISPLNSLGQFSLDKEFKKKLASKGVLVESIQGGEPIDVMNYLGKRNGYKAVAWRAGCWGERGVRSILRGAFQWVSAHLAVDAVGGRFWQLMLAERAIQAACGPESKVKIFADQEDFSLEYCDSESADQDCTLSLNGKPIRHVRVDCRLVLLDENRPRELKVVKTVPMIKSFREEEAPWFI